MGRISSDVGLVSGIKSKDIIDQLMNLEAQPKVRLQTQIDSTNKEKLAFVDLSTRLAGLKLAGTTLKKPSSFEAATTSSTDENVLTATASNGAAIGSFQFQVTRLVTSQQSVTAGFSDFDTTKVGAGTITIEQGGGEVTSQTPLSQLNGGAGVRRGVFRITDRSGKSTVIDTTAAVTLDDVIKKINTSLDVSVKAQIKGNGIKLTDLSGQTTSNLVVQDLGDGFAATDLGLAADGDVDAGTYTGSSINFLSAATSLSNLNDGRGVRHKSGNDFTITTGDGTNINVALGAKATLGDVIDAINTLGAGKVRAQIASSGKGLELVDLSGGGGAFTVAAVNGSKAAADLGIAKTTAGGGTISGDQVLSGLNTVLMSSLNGGLGIPLGTINVTDRSGAVTQIDLSPAKTLQDAMDLISNNTSVSLTASVNSSGNGIQITDDTGGSGNLIIANDDPTTSATFLGIAGTYDPTVKTIKGRNLQRAWVSENSSLAEYNGGKGVPPGKFKITNSAGRVASINLTDGTAQTLGDVINKINTNTIGVVASINANGDGLLLTDSTSGPSKMKVEEDGTNIAKSLNILGVATTNTINGSFEKTITTDATDTLATVQQKITDLGFGVSASIINDGSVAAPYRLSLNAREAGRSGRVVFDAGATDLAASNLVDAQDAAVFLGSPEAAQPLLVTASSNNLSGVIKGVNIELHGVSSKPVTLNVARSVDNIVTQLTTFTDSFNEMIDKFKELTKFDPDTKERGLLLGDSTESRVETETYAMLNQVVSGAGRYRILSDVGLRLGEGAKLEFDEEKFRVAYTTDPDSVKALFSTTTTGIGFVIESRITKLTDPVDGVITRQNKTLDEKNQQFQDRIDSLDKLLTTKRERLERQFANLESVLANLQSQQTAIGQIQTIKSS